GNHLAGFDCRVPLDSINARHLRLRGEQGRFAQEERARPLLFSGMVLSQLGVRVPPRIALAGQDQTGSREPNPRTTEEPRFSYWPGQNEHVRRPRRDVDRGSAVLPAVEPLLKARKVVEKQTADLDRRAIRLAR